jgi:aspartate ammonia-lyase
MDQTANVDVFVEVSGILSAHASNLIKICRDLRTLHFTGEIALPAVQSGSSIMPGKVNPVIMEATIGAAIKVNTNHQIISQCVSLGTLQINEYLPLIASAILESIRLLSSSNVMLSTHVEKIQPFPLKCEEYAHRSITLITAFLPKIGYEKAELLVKEYVMTGRNNFREFLVEKLGLELVDKTLSPASLVALGYREVAS